MTSALKWSPITHPSSNVAYCHFSEETGTHHATAHFMKIWTPKKKKKKGVKKVISRSVSLTRACTYGASLDKIVG